MSRNIIYVDYNGLSDEELEAFMKLYNDFMGEHKIKDIIDAWNEYTTGNPIKYTISAKWRVYNHD